MGQAHWRLGARSALTGLALCALALGCGEVESDPESGAALGGNVGASGSADGVSGGGGLTGADGGGTSGFGSVAIAGSGQGTSGNSSGGATSGLRDTALDDAFPWFVTRPGGVVGAMLDRDGDGIDKVVHVVLSEAPAEATISTHSHLEVVGWARAVNFKAKASAETNLLVSVRASLQADYFAARDAGQIWPTASVQLGTEWRDYSVALAAMMPAETAPALGVPAFTIAFIVHHPTGPFEAWFDQVQFQ